MPNNDLPEAIDFARTGTLDGREAARSKFAEESISARKNTAAGQGNDKPKQGLDSFGKNEMDQSKLVPKQGADESDQFIRGIDRAHKNEVNALDKAITNGTDKLGNKSRSLENENMIDLRGNSGDWVTARKHEPTAEEVKAAKEKLEKEVSKLIPEGERKTLTAMQNALMDGNLTEFDKLVKGFKGKPEELGKFVDEMEKNLKEAGARVHVTLSGEGKVIVYKDGGSSCVEIAPESGKTMVKPISTKFDGTVVLEPGEVLGKKADEVMKGIGNSAVDNIENPFRDRIIEIQPSKRPWRQYPGWEDPFLPGPSKRPYDIPNKGKSDDDDADKYKFLNPNGPKGAF